MPSPLPEITAASDPKQSSLFATALISGKISWFSSDYLFKLLKLTHLSCLMQIRNPLHQDLGGAATTPAEARGGLLCVAIIVSISLICSSGEFWANVILKYARCGTGAHGINVSPLLTGFRFPSHYVKMPV